MYVQGSSSTILFFVLKFQKNPIVFINDTLSIGRQNERLYGKTTIVFSYVKFVVKTLSFKEIE